MMSWWRLPPSQSGCGNAIWMRMTGRRWRKRTNSSVSNWGYFFVMCPRLMKSRVAGLCTRLSPDSIIWVHVTSTCPPHYTRVSRHTELVYSAKSWDSPPAGTVPPVSLRLCHMGKCKSKIPSKLVYLRVSIPNRLIFSTRVVRLIFNSSAARAFTPFPNSSAC